MCVLSAELAAAGVPFPLGDMSDRLGALGGRGEGGWSAAPEGRPAVRALQLMPGWSLLL